ncbi:DUF366 family protein [Methanobacterium alcaliphilum]|uniref:DUF366 family protein n=1 Tax=Methanobacterium alcaliphilum TaxID=392018 RepID=UPI00200A30B5|nr:DUF366 family protein [Methanobacterium alcaliphilum]MCK9151461.1 DUF366 family protein [Methanobacterium alcaliphilum]
MKIIHQHLKETSCYDGSPIQPLWALDKYGIKGSSIISWMGPMEIKAENIVDVEDVGLEIKSDNMAHFIVEHFDCQPADIRICYHRQRILVMLLKEELRSFGIECKRRGDDLFVNSKKLTVSIATISPTSMKIHLGMNITSEGTPDDVKTIGFFECNESLNEKDIVNLINNVSKNYIDEINDIEQDITKTRSFY